MIIKIIFTVGRIVSIQPTGVLNTKIAYMIDGCDPFISAYPLVVDNDDAFLHAVATSSQF